MIKTLTLTITLILYCLSCFCNITSVKDSLLHIVATSSVDSVKVNALKQLAEGGNYSNREESIFFYKQILEHNIEESFRGVVLNRIGFFNWQLGNYDKAISSYNKALTIFAALNDSAYLGRIYNNIAVSHWGLGDNLEALENYQKSLEIRRAVSDVKGVSNVLNNIGKIYQQLRLFDEAFKMHREALTYALQGDDSGPIAYSYSNIGDCFQETQLLDSALHYYITGYNVLLALDPQNRSNSYFSSRIGAVYSLQNQLDSALVYNKKALAYAFRINNKNRIAIAEYNLGKTYIAGNQSDSARLYIERSYEKARENGYDVLLKDNLFLMAELAEAKQNFNEAYKYYKRAAILNDSIYNKEVVSKVADTQVKYVTAQKERENLALRQNNEVQLSTIRQQRIITILLVILSFMAITVLYFIAKSRSDIKKLNMQLADSETHLKKANADKDRLFTIIAHDLKSPFNGILGISELLANDFENLANDHKKELVEMLHKSSLNVYSLLNSLLQWVQAQKNTTHYKFTTLNLHKISSKVWNTLHISAENKNVCLINAVPEDTIAFADENSSETILRNLVSNAIKFSIEGGEVQILSEETDKEIIVEVRDNGVGIPSEIQDKLFLISEKVSQNGTKNEVGTGLGLVLCKELVESNGGKIWVKSKPGEGSSFYFTLPKKQKLPE